MDYMILEGKGIMLYRRRALFFAASQQVRTLSARFNRYLDSCSENAASLSVTASSTFIFGVSF